MFEGDRFIIKHLINHNGPMVSTQFYTPAYDLIKIITSYDVECRSIDLNLFK